jgi:hypothetical protein
MNPKPAAVLLSGLLAACMQTQPPEAAAPPAPSPPPIQPQASAPAQTSATEPASVDHIVDIRRARCEGLMSLSPEDRAAASMFYIGYQASRLRAQTINVGLIPSIQGQAIAYCQANPNRTVAQAFADAYSRTRGR